MRILFLAKHLNAGGITSYLLSLSKGLIKLGDKVFIVSGGGDMEGAFTDLNIKLLKIDLHTKSILHPKIYLQLKQVKQFIAENQIDVIHAHTRVTQIMGRLLSKDVKSRYVSTCHGYFKPKLSRRIFPCWGKKVVAISTAVEKHLICDFHVDQRRIVLVHSGINAVPFASIDQSQRDNAKQAFGFSGKIIIGMVARFSDVKGQDILIRAFKKVVNQNKDVRLILVGQGKFEKDLKSLVSQLKLEEHVVFYPVVDQAQKYLSLIDIFINPSRQEGLGLSVIEAQAAGLPVVASKVGGVVDLIKDGKTGYFFKSEDVDALSEKIEMILNDMQAARQVGACARENVLKYFTIEKMADEMHQVYCNL